MLYWGVYELELLRTVVVKVDCLLCPSLIRLILNDRNRFHTGDKNLKNGTEALLEVLQNTKVE